MFGKSMAHVERIVKTYPVEGADRIEMAQVLDYHVVAQKGEFKAGDLALYVEMDSIVPDGLPQEHQEEMKQLIKKFHSTSGDEKEAIKVRMSELSQLNTIPAFEFLRSRGFKVKMVHFAKLKIYSQGILYSLSKFPQIENPVVGFDATDLLGIKQLVEDADEAGVSNHPSSVGKFLETTSVGKFIDRKLMRYAPYREFKKKLRQPKGVWHPYFPSKSDEDNVQKVFSKMKILFGTKKWYVTEKLEGQNISIVNRRKKVLGIFNKQEFGVCTHHRFMPKYDGSGFWKTVKRLGWKDKVQGIKGSWFIRGEHVGPGIQKNIYGFEETDIYNFDVYEYVIGHAKRKLNYHEWIKFCKDNDIKTVPVLDDDFTLPETVQELLNMSNGFSVFGNKVQREGIVLRLIDDPSISFKVRSPEYLLLTSKKEEKSEKENVQSV